MRKTQFWIWILPVVTIIGLLVVVFPIWQSYLASNTSRPEEYNAHKQAKYTIYNPGKDILQGTAASTERSNFLFEFLERHDIESLDSSADEAWSQAMSTPLGGFLLVKHNETYNLGWGVSMFHSIHCLGMLRSTMQKYFGTASGNTAHGSYTHGSRDGATLNISDRTHVEHCLGYLGRALLCNGDDTLEPPFIKHDAKGNILFSAVDGRGHQHSCRDSTLAWQTVFTSEENPLLPFKWSPGDTIRSVFQEK